MLICLSSLEHQLNSFLIKWYPGQTEREVSPATSLEFETKSSETLLIDIKKKGGPGIALWGTLA